MAWVTHQHRLKRSGCEGRSISNLSAPIPQVASRSHCRRSGWLVYSSGAFLMGTGV